MKKTIFSIMLVTMLMACGGSKPSASADSESDTVEIAVDTMAMETPTQYVATDAISMGLNGHVQSVDIQQYSTYESNGELKDGNLMGRLTMEFDATGHITTDEWGNRYGYDADGRYYRGNHTYTAVKRDKSGRIVEYSDIEPQKESESQFVMTLHYDKNGRLSTIEYGGGLNMAWTEKRHYESGNIYPSKIEKSMTFEGGGAEETTIIYRYTSFDDQHNWTERLCMVSVKEVQEAEVDSFIPEQPKLEEKILVEKRTISYFE